MFRSCWKSSTCAAVLAAGAIGIGVGAVGSLALRPAESVPSTEAALAATVLASFTQPEGEMTPEQIMAMMKEWSALAPEHKELQRMVGTWDCEAKFWMEPEGEPTVSKGTSQSESILGGRFISQHFTMPDFMGQPFEGYGAVGFDKQKGKFVNVWVDNFSTGLTLMTGTFDEKTKTWTWEGTTTSPIGESKMKHVVKNPDADHSIMEFWEANDMTGGEFMKTGEITYTRS